MDHGRGEMDLNSLMAIDHVVYVREDGTVTDDREITKGVYAPEVTCDYSGPLAEAQISDAQECDMIDYVKRDAGWELITGWSRGGGLALMHPSEFIGGALADHVRATPGYWVACVVELYPRETDPEYRDGNGESDAAGWVLAHREAPALPPHPGTTVHPNGLREWDAGIITNF